MLLPLALVCAGIWYYLLKTKFRLETLAPPSVQWEEKLHSQLAQQAAFHHIQEHLRTVSCTYSRMVEYVIEKIRLDVNVYHIFREVRQRSFAPCERDIMVLSALVTSAPLLGLLGTVLGMIDTFQAIALRSRETTELMATGISQGLITTQFGLIIAIPGIFGIIILRKKLQQLDLHLSGLQYHFVLRRRGSSQ